MRFLYGFLLLCPLVFIAGCTTPEGISRPEPTPDTAPGSYQPGYLVKTKFDAISVGGTLFEEKGGIKWTESPNAVLAEEMSYADAVQWIGVSDGSYDLWPQETRVWLVVFKGQWLLIPLDPTQANPAPIHYEGCVFSLFTARDGELISMGDFVCPTN
jgi:hypothetical protein